MKIKSVMDELHKVSQSLIKEGNISDAAKLNVVINTLKSNPAIAKKMK